MTDVSQKTDLVGRRQALKLFGVAAAGGALILAGCNTKPAAESAAGDAAKAGSAPGSGAAGGSCQDKVAIEPEKLQIRTVLQYMEKSNNPAKQCSSCAQYIAAQYGNCGGCKLLAGAVNPAGLCLSYAPIAAPGAAPGAAPAAGKPG